MFHLIEQLVDFVAVGESDVRFAQQTAYLSFQFVLVNVDHDHESDQIVEQRRQ